ncbi:MAG: hypothetical protein QW727_00360 [Candidatus Pacearchaeota archaeon]
MGEESDTKFSVVRKYVGFFLLFLLFMGFFIYDIHINCYISSLDQNKNSFTLDVASLNVLNPLKHFYKLFYDIDKHVLPYSLTGILDFVFQCKQKPTGIISSIWLKTKNILGFDQTLYEFFYPDLVTGLLIGLWIWLIYELSIWTIKVNLLRLIPKLKERISGLIDGEVQSIKSGWLGFLGSSPWKIIPIAVFYAVIMQIPIINFFIEVITFKPLFQDSLFGVIIVRSIIIAFYIGLLPSFIESYTRYRLRMKYYNKILEVKYGVKIAKEFGRG